MNDKKHIHFIGICGVAMSALAIAYHKKGYKVTGSDKGFYPPVSTYLKESGISYYPGWHVDKMTIDGDPNIVVVGNVAGSKNPEWLYVQENGIEYVSYPEAIARDFVKNNSIVCAGTYGKSTSSSILTWILRETGYDPSYMFGGISLNDMPAAKLTDSDYSVLEGDEYKTARWDDKAKFFHYSPTHLLLTSVVWDHADVYPTEKSYIDAFEKLVTTLPSNGTLVLSAKVLAQHPQFARLPHCTIISYGRTEDNDYQYTNVQTSTEGISFDIVHNSEIYNLHSAILGDYTPDNMTGCFATAHQLGISPEKIISALESYKGLKRRLERRYANDVAVFDDIAHSPKKAEATLRSLKALYPGTVYAIYEPNGGNRMHSSIPGYAGKFVHADIVIIPRLSVVKKNPDEPAPLDGPALRDVIARSHSDVRYIEDDEALVSLITEQTKKGDVVAFLGSHGFRNMITQLISRLSL